MKETCGSCCSSFELIHIDGSTFCKNCYEREYVGKSVKSINEIKNGSIHDGLYLEIKKRSKEIREGLNIP